MLGQSLLLKEWRATAPLAAGDSSFSRPPLLPPHSSVAKPLNQKQFYSSFELITAALSGNHLPQIVCREAFSLPSSPLPHPPSQNPEITEGGRMWEGLGPQNTSQLSTYARGCRDKQRDGRGWQFSPPWGPPYKQEADFKQVITQVMNCDKVIVQKSNTTN